MQESLKPYEFAERASRSTILPYLIFYTNSPARMLLLGLLHNTGDVGGWYTELKTFEEIIHTSPLLSHLRSAYPQLNASPLWRNSELLHSLPYNGSLDTNAAKTGFIIQPAVRDILSQARQIAYDYYDHAAAPLPTPVDVLGPRPTDITSRLQLFLVIGHTDTTLQDIKNYLFPTVYTGKVLPWRRKKIRQSVQLALDKFVSSGVCVKNGNVYTLTDVLGKTFLDNYVIPLMDLAARYNSSSLFDTPPDIGNKITHLLAYWKRRRWS